MCPKASFKKKNYFETMIKSFQWKLDREFNLNKNKQIQFEFVL